MNKPGQRGRPNCGWSAARSPDVCRCTLSALRANTNSWMSPPIPHPFRVSDPTYNVLFPPHSSDSATFETHNCRGPNWASFKRLYQKRPGAQSSPSRRSFVSGSLPIQHASVSGPLAAVLRPDDRCLYFHKTGVIHSNGDVPTCSAPFAKEVGDISGDISFREIWNGTLMTAVRRDFGTDREWLQCRSCWFRELKWHSQRHASNAAQVFDIREPHLLDQGVGFSKKNTRTNGQLGGPVLSASATY